MTIFTFVPFFEHVWQSTLVLAFIVCFQRILRDSRASVRYALWVVASAKFLLPFAALMWIGSRLVSFAASGAVADVSSTARDIFMPGSMGALVPSSFLYSASFPRLAIAAWAAGAFVVLLACAREWQVVRAAHRAASPVDIALPPLAGAVRVMSTPARLEPGIVGICRPILLLPDGIVSRLSASELNAIVAHELCHLRRRDNLTALLHVAVEVVFWFHPFVWWVERQMLVERERACDETVLGSGIERDTYAQAILTVCRHYVESPLAVVSGVTGGSLVRRIEAIAAAAVPRSLTPAKKAVLAAASIVAVGFPIALGGATLGTARTVLTHDLPIVADAHAPAAPAPVPAPPIRRAASAETSRAQTNQRSTIEGTVTDSLFSQPIEGVAVEVESDDPNTPTRTRTTTTDSAGAYKIEGLPAGVYSVLFRHDDYMTFKREGLRVPANTKVSVSPAMKEQRIRD